MSARRHAIPTPVVFGILILALLLSACSVPTAETPSSVASPTSTAIPGQLLSEVEFRATLPAAIPSTQKLVLEIVDEVTGLALNATRLDMNKVDATHYSLKTAFPAGSLVKYRYMRLGGVTAIEYSSLSRQVRYRMFYDRNPAVVDDIVSAWNDTPFKGSFGRIQGRVIDRTKNVPIAGSLISAGGQQILSASDGSFVLDGLPIGKHNLVVYSLDGAFPPFQQEAVVAAEASTPADIRLDPVKLVNITFVVKAPGDVPEGIPMRMIGNTYSLGNTFADLRGGISAIASRAPLLTYLKDRQYAFTIRLPVGLDLRYKYTLGDGFWNAERKNTGKFQVRQLIVPDGDKTIEDAIETFTTPGMGPVQFNVDAVAGIGKNEVVSIQFNPYGWTEPIPMWQLGDGNWLYILYTPLDADMVGDAEYRYCKNDQCGIADDSATSGPDTAGKPFKPTSQPQTIKDTIRQWAWTPENRPTITVTSDKIAPKPAGFVTGVELLPGYNPSWQAYMGSAFDNIKEMRSDWVILSPTWHFLSQNPPVLTEVPGLDATWYDLARMGASAREKGLHIAVHPSTAYYQPDSVWWQTASRDPNWWQSWFDRYETFVLNHADYANQIGAEALILGDDTISPALPGGKLFDGSPSGVPGDASKRWSALFAQIRSRYNGKIIWRLNYPVDIQDVPEFLTNVDEIYLVMDGKISDAASPTNETLRGEITQMLEKGISSIHEKFPKPILLGIAYPSVTGAATGCVQSGDICFPRSVFEQAGLDLPSLTQNLAEQADIYNAVFESLNQNNWIEGVIASGYNPAVSLQDKSISVRGKPAADVVWFWFDHFKGAGQ